MDLSYLNKIARTPMTMVAKTASIVVGGRPYWTISLVIL